MVRLQMAVTFTLVASRPVDLTPSSQKPEDGLQLTALEKLNPTNGRHGSELGSLQMRHSPR